MSYTLESVCDRITAFIDIEKEFGFYEHGTGEKPWSRRFVNVKGDCFDMRGTDWTYYSNGKEVRTGTSPESLKAFLQGFEEMA